MARAPRGPKTLESGSKYETFDTDGDGVVTDAEIAVQEKMIQIENQDKREDAQRNMAWFALFGMLLYPFAILLASLMELDQASKTLGSMAPTYFVSVAAIVAAFYGKEAYTKGK